MPWKPDKLEPRIIVENQKSESFQKDSGDGAGIQGGPGDDRLGSKGDRNSILSRGKDSEKDFKKIKRATKTAWAPRVDSTLSSTKIDKSGFIRGNEDTESIQGDYVNTGHAASTYFDTDSSTLSQLLLTRGMIQSRPYIVGVFEFEPPVYTDSVEEEIAGTTEAIDSTGVGELIDLQNQLKQIKYEQMMDYLKDSTAGMGLKLADTATSFSEDNEHIENYYAEMEDARLILEFLSLVWDDIVAVFEAIDVRYHDYVTSTHTEITDMLNIFRIQALDLDGEIAPEHLTLEEWLISEEYGPGVPLNDEGKIGLTSMQTVLLIYLDWARSYDALPDSYGAGEPSTVQDTFNSTPVYQVPAMTLGYEQDITEIAQKLSTAKPWQIAGYYSGEGSVSYATIDEDGALIWKTVTLGDQYSGDEEDYLVYSDFEPIATMSYRNLGIVGNAFMRSIVLGNMWWSKCGPEKDWGDGGSSESTYINTTLGLNLGGLDSTYFLSDKLKLSNLLETLTGWETYDSTSQGPTFTKGEATSNGTVKDVMSMYDNVRSDTTGRVLTFEQSLVDYTGIVPSNHEPLKSGMEYFVEDLFTSKRDRAISEINSFVSRLSDLKSGLIDMTNLMFFSAEPARADWYTGDGTLSTMYTNKSGDDAGWTAAYFFDRVLWRLKTFLEHEHYSTGTVMEEGGMDWAMSAGAAIRMMAFMLAGEDSEVSFANYKFSVFMHEWLLIRDEGIGVSGEINEEKARQQLVEVGDTAWYEDEFILMSPFHYLFYTVRNNWGKVWMTDGESEDTGGHFGGFAGGSSGTITLGGSSGWSACDPRGLSMCQIETAEDADAEESQSYPSYHEQTVLDGLTYTGSDGAYDWEGIYGIVPKAIQDFLAALNAETGMNVTANDWIAGTGKIPVQYFGMFLMGQRLVEKVLQSGCQMQGFEGAGNEDSTWENIAEYYYEIITDIYAGIVTVIAGVGLNVIYELAFDSYLFDDLDDWAELDTAWAGDMETTPAFWFWNARSALGTSQAIAMFSGYDADEWDGILEDPEYALAEDLENMSEDEMWTSGDYGYREQISHVLEQLQKFYSGIAISDLRVINGLHYAAEVCAELSNALTSLASDASDATGSSEAAADFFEAVESNTGLENIIYALLSEGQLGLAHYHLYALGTANRKFPYLPVTKAVIAQEVGNLAAMAVEKPFLLDSDSGRNRIFSIGLPAGLVSALRTENADNSDYKYSRLICIQVFRKNMVTDVVELYSRVFNFDVTKYILDGFPDQSDSISEYAAGMTRADVEESTPIWRFDAYGFREVVVGKSEFENANSYESFSGSPSASAGEVFDNLLVDHYIKLYLKLTTGIEINEEIFGFLRKGAVIAGDVDDGKSGEFIRMVEEMRKTFDLGTYSSIEIERFQEDLKRSIMFSTEKYKTRILYPKVFDRVFCFMVDEGAWPDGPSTPGVEAAQYQEIIEALESESAIEIGVGLGSSEGFAADVSNPTYFQYYAYAYLAPDQGESGSYVGDSTAAAAKELAEPDLDDIESESKLTSSWDHLK